MALSRTLVFMNDPQPTAQDIYDAPASWVVLAHLLRPQGRKGEVLADLLTDFPELFSERQGISLRRRNGVIETVGVEAHWLPVGRNAGRVVLQLAGVNSIEAAEALVGCDVVIPAAERVALEDDAEYIGDLLGCTLCDGEQVVGIVEDVQFPAAPSGQRLPEAAPLLVISAPEGAEVLVPFVKIWLEAVDLPNKRLVMRLPAGLLEINLPDASSGG